MESLIVIVIVAAAVVLTAVRLYRQAAGKGSCCGAKGRLRCQGAGAHRQDSETARREGDCE